MTMHVEGLRCLCLFVCILGLLAMQAMAGEKWIEDPSKVEHCATISPLAKAPVLDGKIDASEWDNATGTVNFLNTFGKLSADFNGMHMDLREGRTLVGYHGETLYIAVVSALPPRAIYGAGKHSIEKARDAELIGDFNALEIWLDPNRDRRESGKGDQAFYQVFVNSVGSVYDARLNPGEAPDKGWNTDIKSAHHIDGDKKIWTAELAISLKAFGWTEKDIAGRSMGMLIARNYKAQWNQATWFPHGGAFVSWQLYPRVFFMKDSVVARIESLGDGLWNAQPTFTVKMFNPGPARKAEVKLFVKSSDMPDITETKTIDLPANGTGEYVHAVTGERLHVQADHLFNIKVTEAGKTKQLFHYTGMWSHDPHATKGSGAASRPVRRSVVLPFDQKWAIRAEANPKDSVGVAVYPYYNLIKYSIDCSQLVADPDGVDKPKLSDKASVTIAREGKEIAKQDFAWDLSQKQFGMRHDFKLKELPAGEYTVTTRFNKHAEPIVKTYTREVYPWEHNTIGITDKIYPPFKAVAASHAVTKVVCRDYGVGDLGLWNSIKSLEKELLAAPIVLKADGTRILKGNATLTKSTPMAATYEASAADEAITVKSVTTTEIDGCMKVSLTLLPGTKKAELKSLALEIPLKVEEMPLWHACTTALRVNPMGYLPKGEGVVWDSNKFPNGDWIGAFVPYIWMGGVERGLAVFGNNDKGWVLNWNQKKQFTPCQEFIRTGDTITIRLNLVQKPITLDEPRTIVLGLMASPGKPIPYKDWRSISAWHAASLGKDYDWMAKHSFDMGWAVETVFAAAYPYNRDYSIYDAQSVIPGTPAGDMVIKKGWGAFVKDWKKRNGLDKPDEELTHPQKYAISRAGRKSADRKFMYNGNYWDEYHHDYQGHPECKVFNGEWRTNMARSRQDFRCYYGAETVKRGIGLYFDNAYAHASKDLITSDAYEIPGFGIQPSAGLWEQRDYHRRIWNIHREFGARWNNKPMSMIHMTNTNMITMLTWNDMNVDLEWFYGPEPQQSKYGLPMMQAETSARQSGCVPFALAIIERCKNAAEQRMAERSKFGCMMVHEVRMSFFGSEIQKLARLLFGFGYGLSGVIDSQVTGDTVYNYWDDEYPMACDKELVKSLLVKRGGELMLLIASWDKNPTSATFTIDTKALDIQLFTAWNAEGTAEEQLGEAREKIASLQKILPGLQEELAIAERRCKEKPDNNHFKNVLNRAKLAVARTERPMKSLQELLPVIETAAKMPVAFDPKAKKLTVGLEGYGVRLIRLK